MTPTAEADAGAAGAPAARGSGLGVVLALVVGGALYAGLFAVGGEAARVAVSGLESLPFLVLAVLAYAARRRVWARWLTVVWLALFSLGFALSVLGISSGFSDPARWSRSAEFARVAQPILAGVVLAWCAYLAPVRRLAARFLPLDPRSFVHATALVTVLLCIWVSVVPLVVLGEPPLLRVVEQRGAEVIIGDRSATGQILDTVYGLVWLVPAAVVAVGFPLARDLPAAMRRLGLVRPTWGQVRLGVTVAVLMALTMSFAFNRLVDTIWSTVGWPTTNTQSFEQLVSFALSPLGALVVGVTAGLGEEVAVRGVLQPRLGIVLPNLFFTALHAFQYGPDGLLTVFVLGLILGRLRQATNTTTSAIAHGLYDFIVIMASVVGLPGS